MDLITVQPFPYTQVLPGATPTLGKPPTHLYHTRVEYYRGMGYQQVVGVYRDRESALGVQGNAVLLPVTYSHYYPLLLYTHQILYPREYRKVGPLSTYSLYYTNCTYTKENYPALPQVGYCRSTGAGRYSMVLGTGANRLLYTRS